MEDLITFRLDQHDEQIQHIRKHNHDVNNGLIVVNEGLKLINKNIDDMVEKFLKISERLEKLEDELNIRKYKNTLVSTIIKNWPIVIILIILFASLDISKLIELVKHIK